MQEILSVSNNDFLLRNAFFDELFKYFKDCSNVFHYSDSITRFEFFKVMSVIYDVLNSRFGVSFTKGVIQGYVSLLVSDAVDGFDVDYNFLISHLWYLSNLPNNVSTSYCDAVNDILHSFCDEYRSMSFQKILF